ncbi:hypothetical protein Tco_0773179 [Tanacetum coccineum]|uniref:Uncharacterized protein n=1 Tax=Tanacetum coccineum TaxID=301880 RepID=A0ABQ4ZNU3_9ASTR
MIIRSWLRLYCQRPFAVDSLIQRIMPPKARPMTQAAIEQLITQRVNAALVADRANRGNVGGDVGGNSEGPAGGARG